MRERVVDGAHPHGLVRQATVLQVLAHQDRVALVILDDEDAQHRIVLGGCTGTHEVVACRRAVHMRPFVRCRRTVSQDAPGDEPKAAARASHVRSGRRVGG